MPKKIRVHELAKELGLTNAEALDLCAGLGMDVKTHSSGVEDAQADRARRKAHRQGMVRDVQPEEPPRPGKKGPSKPGKKPSGSATGGSAGLSREYLEGLGLGVELPEDRVTGAATEDDEAWREILGMSEPDPTITVRSRPEDPPLVPFTAPVGRVSSNRDRIGRDEAAAPTPAAPPEPEPPKASTELLIARLLAEWGPKGKRRTGIWTVPVGKRGQLVLGHAASRRLTDDIAQFGADLSNLSVAPFQPARQALHGSTLVVTRALRDYAGLKPRKNATVYGVGDGLVLCRPAQKPTGGPAVMVVSGSATLDETERGRAAQRLELIEILLLDAIDQEPVWDEVEGALRTQLEVLRRTISPRRPGKRAVLGGGAVVLSSVQSLVNAAIWRAHGPAIMRLIRELW